MSFATFNDNLAKAMVARDHGKWYLSGTCGFPQDTKKAVDCYIEAYNLSSQLMEKCEPAVTSMLKSFHQIR